MRKTKRLMIIFMLSFCISLGVVDYIPFVNNCYIAQAATVKISKKNATMYVGKTLKLKISGTKSKVKWKTSNKKIATVSKKGAVNAKKAGKVTISAVVNRKTYKCKVTVKNVPKAKISLSSQSSSLYVGDTLRLTANTENYNGSITWSSSVPSVAIVNNGIVTAKSKGTTIITATAGSTQAICLVTVREHSITYITDRFVEYVSNEGVHRVFFSLKYEDGITRTSSSGYATISIKNANGEMVYNKNIDFSQNNFANWTSTLYGTRYLCCIEIKKSDISVGTADIGNLSFGVQLNNGISFSPSTYSISNLPVVEPTISLDNSEISLFEGESLDLKATVQNYNKALSWTSSNTDVATCYDGKVSAKAQGTTTITVTAGTAKATCLVTVKPIDVTFICVDGQTVSYNRDSNYVKFTDVTYSVSQNTMIIKFKATRMGATYDYLFADYKIVSGDTVVKSGPVTGSTSLSDLGAGESAQYSISVPVVNGGTYELLFKK